MIRANEAGIRGFGEGGVAAILAALLVGLGVRHRRAAKIPASLPMIDLQRKACEEKFDLREIGGLAVYRPVAATTRARGEIKGRVIIALPDFAGPDLFAELAWTLADDFNRWDVQMIGSPYDPLVTTKGGWGQAGRYQRWARRAEIEAHRRLMSEKGELYPGTPLVLVGIADGCRHTLRALGDLEIHERTSVQRAILVAPQTTLHATGDFREPSWMQSARRRDRESFDRQVGRGEFSGLGDKIEVVSTFKERGAQDGGIKLRGQLGLGRESGRPVMARPGSWEVTKGIVGLVQPLTN